MSDEALIIDITKDRKGIYDDAAAPINNRHGGYVALDGKVVGETKQCCHCQAHWIYRKGSGAIRHFCPHCMQSTCGNERCHPNHCGPGGFMHWERQMERIEAECRKRAAVESWLSL